MDFTVSGRSLMWHRKSNGPNTIFYSRINSKFGLHNVFVCPVEEDMGHRVGWMELQRLCTLVFISILHLSNDNY